MIMNMSKKELEEQITRLINEPIKYDYRKHAFEELESIEKETKKQFPHIAFIINEYPDFDSVCFKATMPKRWVFKIFVNPDTYKNLPPKKKKKMIKKLVKMYLNLGK